jgi:hypothetical protein
MAYTVNTTNGSILATVADGTIDTTTTNLTLIGKNYSGYGELLNENFVKLLENFSNTSQPSAPTTGQLWWDTTNQILKVYNGTSFKVVSGSTSSATQPTSAIAGDLWFDSDNDQLYVYNGSSWVLIGPSFTSGTGESGAIVETIADNLGTNHVVVRMYVADDTVAMISKDAQFTPQSAISGFATISPGIQLSSTVAGATFTGSVSNSQQLDGLDSTQFLRSDQNDSTSGILTIGNDGGLIVGSDSDLEISVTGNNVTIANGTTDGDIIIDVNKSSGGVTSALLFDGTTAAVLPGEGDSTGSIGTASVKWANVYADTLNGTAVEAQYADLAERFESDAVYAEGTVVALGGAAEVTAVNEDASNNVFGVVSSRAAYLMNSGAGTNETHPAIAMTGRVPVRVVGTVLKGQRLVSSNIPGVARAAQDDDLTGFNTVGRAIEDKYTQEEATVMAVVRINS